MANDIVADFNTMLELSRIFRAAHEAFAETATECKEMAGALEDGALLGIAGEKASNALQSVLGPGFQRLSDKFLELSDEIAQAVNDLSQGSNQSASRFSSR